jgi:hypothetical protein
MLIRTILAVAMAAGIGACASPLVAPNPPSFQAKVEHLNDWQMLAQRAVAKIPRAANNLPAVYVDAGESASPFSVVYKQDLEQALYEANYPVVTSRELAQVVVRFDSEWFYYGNGNEKPITNYATLYGLAALVMGQTRNISRVDTALGVAAATGPVVDFLAAMNDITRAEVSVRTTISSEGRLHYSGSENIYVQPRDLTFYMGGDAPLDMPVVPLQISAGR